MDRDFVADTRRFFDQFVEAFKTFDGAIVAQQYCDEFIAVAADGSLQRLTTPAAIAEYFQGFLDAYCADGCAACQYQGLETTVIGQVCVLATVDWQLQDKAGQLVSSWRESYNLCYQAEKLRAFASIDHAA